MSHDRVGYKNLAFNLPDNGAPPDCDDGAIWANITANELYVCLGGSEKNIPHSGYHRCSLSKSVDQTIPTDTWTSLLFDQEEIDIGGLHDNVTNNPRITIQKDGEYRFYYQLKIQSEDKSSYEARIYQDGTTVVQGTCNLVIGSKDSSHLCLNLVSPILLLSIGEYFELQVFHDTGGDRDVLASDTFFGIQRSY